MTACYSLMRSRATVSQRRLMSVKLRLSSISMVWCAPSSAVCERVSVCERVCVHVRCVRVRVRVHACGPSTDLDVRVLLHVPSLYPERANLRVKLHMEHGYTKGCAHTLRVDTPGVALLLHFAAELRLVSQQSTHKRTVRSHTGWWLRGCSHPQGSGCTHATCPPPPAEAESPPRSRLSRCSS
jgi:hypothetical protein